MSGVSFRPAIEFSPAELAGFLSTSFENYIVNIPFTPALAMSMVRTESVDLLSSPVAFAGEEMAGVAMIGRRSREARLAAMAIPVPFRGKGVGRQLVQHVLQESRDRGEDCMHLECISSNTPALKLYEALGFHKTRDLLGFSRAAGAAGSPVALEEVSLSEVALLGRSAPSHMPWQAAWQTLAASCLPSRAYRLGNAYAAITDTAQPVVGIRAILVDGEKRKGSGSRMIQALVSNWPEKAWRVPPLWPGEIAPGFWERNGFVQDSLSQVQMICRY